MLEAAQRVKNREPIIRRYPNARKSPDIPADARFVMSLSGGEMVLITVGDCERLMVVSSLVSTQKRIHLVSASDARRSSQKKDIGVTPNSLIAKYAARKVTVDPLGRIRWAND